MKRIIEHISVFLVGGILYSIIEILWRGYTHWTMTVVGGLCFLFLYLLNGRMRERSLLERCLAGAGIITAVEFVAGIVVNRILFLDVWDYSAMRFHLLGQVCLFFSCMWFALCIPAYLLSNMIRRFFDEIELDEIGESF